MELAVSNAERRALLHGESLAFPRVGDIYTALPGITGKIELEYEGEMKGADVVVREIIRTAILRVYDRYFAETNTQQIEQWFNLGGTVKIEDSQSAKATLAELEQIQGLFEKLSPLGIKRERHAGKDRRRSRVPARRSLCAQEAQPQRRARLLRAGTRTRQRRAQPGTPRRSSRVRAMAAAPLQQAAQRLELGIVHHLDGSAPA